MERQNGAPFMNGVGLENGHPVLPTPCIKVLDYMKYQRFRYEKEKRNAKKQREKKLVTFELRNIPSDSQVKMFLVDTKNTSVPHPNALVGQHCTDGVYTHPGITGYLTEKVIKIPYLQILRVKKNEMKKELENRTKSLPNCYHEKSIAASRSDEAQRQYDTNTVLLCICITHENSLQPLAVQHTGIMRNERDGTKLEIDELSHFAVSVRGTTPIFIFTKEDSPEIEPDDLEIHIKECDKHDNIVWVSQVFTPHADDIKYKHVIKYSVPAYQDLTVEAPVKVKLILRCKSTNEKASSDFMYEPEPDMIYHAKLRRKQPVGSKRPSSPVADEPVAKTMRVSPPVEKNHMTKVRLKAKLVRTSGQPALVYSGQEGSSTVDMEHFRAGGFNIPSLPEITLNHPLAGEHVITSENVSEMEDTSQDDDLEITKIEPGQSQNFVVMPLQVPGSSTDKPVIYSGMSPIAEKVLIQNVIIAAEQATQHTMPVQDESSSNQGFGVNWNYSPQVKTVLDGITADDNPGTKNLGPNLRISNPDPLHPIPQVTNGRHNQINILQLGKSKASMSSAGVSHFFQTELVSTHETDRNQQELSKMVRISEKVGAVSQPESESVAQNKQQSHVPDDAQNQIWMIKKGVHVMSCLESTNPGQTEKLVAGPGAQESPSVGSIFCLQNKSDDPKPKDQHGKNARISKPSEAIQQVSSGPSLLDSVNSQNLRLQISSTETDTTLKVQDDNLDASVTSSKTSHSEAGGSGQLLWPRSTPFSKQSSPGRTSTSSSDTGQQVSPGTTPVLNTTDLLQLGFPVDALPISTSNKSLESIDLQNSCLDLAQFVNGESLADIFKKANQSSAL